MCPLRSSGGAPPSLAAEDALRIAVDLATGKSTTATYPRESFTKAVGTGCDNIDEYDDPQSVF